MSFQGFGRVTSSTIKLIQRNLHNRALDMIRNYRKLAGASRHAWSSTTITPGVGNTVRVESIEALDTIIAAIDSTQDHLRAQYTKAFVNYDAYCADCHFLLVPFIVIMENGETVNSGAASSNETDPMTEIDSVINGQFQVALGDPIRSSEFRDNGSAHYRAQGNLDILQFVRQYNDYYQGAALREVSNLEFDLGAYVFCASTNKSVVVTTLTTFDYHFVPNSHI